MRPRHRSGKMFQPAHLNICMHVLTIEDAAARKAKRTFQEFFDKLIEFMREDDTFDALYKRPSFQGSTYENTKIVLPNEFDINLELALSDYFEMKVHADSSYPGYARIKVKEAKQVNDINVLNMIKNDWVTKDHYLCQDVVLNWLKSVVDRALNQMNDEKITRRESGPAITLYVDVEDIKQFSVDLVPSLHFKTEDLPGKQYMILKNASRDVDLSDVGWHLVPRRPRNGNGKLVDDVTLWRMSFYLYEKKIMHDLYGMKPALRLMKWFRDRQGWNFLSSYYIKTIFLWELQSEGRMFWKETVQGDLFLNMLDALKECLSKREIPFFWDRDLNLIDHVSDYDLDTSFSELSDYIERIDNFHDEDDDDAVAEVLSDMFDIDFPLDESYQRNPVMGPAVMALHQEIISSY